MDARIKDLRIDSKRLKTNFLALSKIGATKNGGVHRPALGEAHLEARAWFKKRAEEAGLRFQVDGAGNHSAILPARLGNSPTFLLGSHLDSVPNGGRFDGALGMLAAFECLCVLKEKNISLPVTLEAIDFTDEEGTLVGLLGSSALVGSLSMEELKNPRGGREILLAGFQRSGLNDRSVLNAKRDRSTINGYLELHIEQGKRLETAGVDIGVVSSIVGITSYQIIFKGRADHAGTTSMEDRLDAAQGAGAFTITASEIVRDQFPGCVSNVGNIHFSPGAFNIIPGEAIVGLEFRSPDVATHQKLASALIESAQSKANLYGLKLEIKHLASHPPAPMSPHVQQAIIVACDHLGLSHKTLPSFAGHDAQSMASICPAGMIFVPSVNGSSHSPDEYTTWDDCINGANVLLQATINLIENYSTTSVHLRK